MYSIHDEINLKKILEENGEPKFRYAQIENAIYKNFITDFDEISTISKKSKEILKENFFYSCLKIKKIVDSSDDQTSKLLFETEDWHLIEAVIMRHLSGRNTLCISSQVWCPMWCIFCATGKLGFTRNLTFYEIVDQIMFADLYLNKEWKNLRNVVFMWMWEPFLNYENVKIAINTICAKSKLDFSSRRVTVSTCWIVPWIQKIAIDFPQVSLAVSLHAPTDELRKQIMPVENSYNLNELMKALDEYVDITNKRIFYEYIMIEWVNDSLEMAYKLAELLDWKLAHINFIPYNIWEWTIGIDVKPSSDIVIKKFQDIIKKSWITSTIRHTMWYDIDAACGQLALKNKEE